MAINYRMHWPQKTKCKKSYICIQNLNLDGDETNSATQWKFLKNLLLFNGGWAILETLDSLIHSFIPKM